MVLLNTIIQLYKNKIQLQFLEFSPPTTSTTSNSLTISQKNSKRPKTTNTKSLRNSNQTNSTKLYEINIKLKH
jgi:hypothetical protein